MKILLLFILLPFFSTGQFIINEDFETGALVAAIGTQHAANSYAQTFGNFHGRNCMRFELRNGDPEASGGTRTEIKLYDVDNLGALTTPIERWYSFKLFYDTWGNDLDDLTWQAHQSGGASPSISIETKRDTFRIRSRIDPPATNGPNDKIGLGTINKTQWNQWVMHINYSTNSDGYIQVWRNDTLLTSVTGPNMYTATSPYINPTVKMGIYKWLWNLGGTTDQTVRVLMYDDIRVADATGSYTLMTSTAVGDAAPPPNTHTSIPVKGKYKLVKVN